MLPFVARPDISEDLRPPERVGFGWRDAFRRRIPSLTLRGLTDPNACYDSRAARLARRLLPATRRLPNIVDENQFAGSLLADNLQSRAEILASY